MSREDSPARATDAAIQGGGLASVPSPAEADEDYWNVLIDEKEAARFLGVKDRFMQNRRQHGGGAQYIVISSRCIRYRRRDLKAFADARLRTSTSDPGQDAVDMKRGNAPAAGQRVMGGHRGGAGDMSTPATRRNAIHGVNESGQP